MGLAPQRPCLSPYWFSPRPLNENRATRKVLKIREKNDIILSAIREFLTFAKNFYERSEMSRYNPADFEKKWQKKWAEAQVFAAEDFSKKKKFTMLTEFPYPSGAGLHMGHLREYTLGDILARWHRQNGENVLFPMGFDAFGLPTENFAIKNHISPQSATETNTANFRKQLDMMGYSFDWNRSFATSDPEYYRWTQWMFLQFFKAGMAYRAKTTVNWCPFCKTGVANEEVVNGRHERCDTLVEKKEMTQWMLRITDYADQLIDGLKGLDFPDRIANQQINWIGRSSGAEVDFDLTNGEKLTVFTTRPDTVYGATFLVVAPESEFAKSSKKFANNWEDISQYIKTATAKTDIERQENSREKTGVKMGGIYAKNPFTGENLPIFVADYVLGGYGTGAIMAVPAHDERDFAFAKKFGLEIKQVVGAKNQDDTELPFVAKNGILVNSGDLDGMDFAEAKNALFAKNLPEIREKTQYKLRDWVYSRQHYWGEPIPIIYCDEHGAVPVPEKDLPVELPAVESYEPTDDGTSPLSRIPEFVNTVCPICGKPAKRETDTMPNWAGSNWYYLRYYDAHNNAEFASREKLDYWRDVDLYLGGMEHTTLHLLYSRFHHQFLYNQGLVPTPEPYHARRGQGIVLASDGRKMSKSLGNVVDPTEIVDAGYGADAARVAIAFIAPYEMTTPWSPEGVAGAYRFLGRIWKLAEEISGNKAEKSDIDAQKSIAKAVKKVGDDLKNMSFNTSVAVLMETLNVLVKLGAEKIAKEDFANYVAILSPFAPHIASEIFEKFGFDTVNLQTDNWPKYDEKLLVQDFAKIAVQVNGKVRAVLEMSPSADKNEVEQAAKTNENVAKFIDGKEIAKMIYVPGKILNIVAK